MNIFKKALKSRLQSYLDKLDIIAKDQYGFRQKMSTSNAIYELIIITYTQEKKHNGFSGFGEGLRPRTP